VEVRLFHPQIARRPCEACKLYVYDDKCDGETWTFAPGPTTFQRTGNKPVSRGPKEKPPCDHDPKACPKGHHTNPIELSEQNQQALDHYHECRAVSQFPDDSIVRQNAAIIRGLEDDRDRLDAMRQAMLLESLLRVRG
jgi:hypothetical protein